MADESSICPYTGLRSFSEEEALYFKGREAQIDQISRLLERNKFLMVTGASGEGKSSLIFAGLIPNARAGFFKARYNNWVVAAFRPERTPVKNMAGALATATGNQATTIDTELRRGFASLVDLYKNSDLYIDEQSEAWQQLAEPDKKSRKRTAANLLILVDQFEEFFTNPENFHNGTPSQDSQIVVNILLETAKITLNEGLPIYVVCTMRSDYIGQCATFRGLPEYIGFSQFFVPRLKRKELKQVIEEPAILSGNRISQRLVERLVYDLAEGIDQLPILQHALSQIWLAASHGQEEMDLIHYAMVGGMAANELPETDQPKLERWLQDQPETHRAFYSETGLDKVIELHANRLYEGAAEYYNASHPEAPIPARDAKNIVALAFACLTKIDNSRAVRNRMTLSEITNIINRPELGLSVVSGVLDVFREESNSFIRPFKEPDAAPLPPDTALDITHESLIRNWGRLNRWATQEYEFYSTLLDFQKQMDRWKANKKSPDYLLPIGPLSFFENWYARCKPNAHWISRYLGTEEGQGEKTQALELLADIQDFIRRSARKVVITRTFMRYGANRIAAITTMLLMVLLSGFYWIDADRKKNASVIDLINTSSERLMNSKDAVAFAKADFLLIQERFKAGSMLAYIGAIRDDRARLQMAVETYREALIIDKRVRWPFRMDLVRLIDKEFKSFKKEKTTMSFLLEKANVFVALLAYDNYFNPSTELGQLLKNNAAALYPLINTCYGSKEYVDPGISSHLTLANFQWLTFGSPEQKQVQEVLKLISPWQSAEAKLIFDLYFPPGTYQGVYDMLLDHGGAYHVLAALYAAAGDIQGIQKCFETFSGDSHYFDGRFVFNNYANVIGYLYQFGYADRVQPVVSWIVSHQSISESDVYSHLFDNTGNLKFYYLLNIVDGLNQSYNGDFNPNLAFLDEEQVRQVSEDFEESLRRLPSPEKDFRLALYYKQRAVISHQYHFDRGLPDDSILLNSWLNKSWKSFDAVPASYRQGKVSLNYRYYSDGKRIKSWTRRQLYLYPDPFGAWLNNSYYSDLFFNYLSRTHDLKQVYNEPGDMELLQYWIANSSEIFPPTEKENSINRYTLPDSILEKVISLVEQHPDKGTFDPNRIQLILANRAFARGDAGEGFRHYSLLDQGKLYATANTYEYLNKTFVYNQIKDLAINLAVAGYGKESMVISEKFESANAVILSYAMSADAIYAKRYDPFAFVLLDSALTKMKRVELATIPPYEDFRRHLLFALGRIGGESIEQKANSILKDLKQVGKGGGSTVFCAGLAYGGNFHRALVTIPSTFTDTQELTCRTFILMAACEEQERITGATEWKTMTDFFEHDFNYIFYDPN